MTSQVFYKSITKLFQHINENGTGFMVMLVLSTHVMPRMISISVTICLFNTAKTRKRKQKETSTVKGILSVNRLLFLAAPTVFPEENQHTLEETEDQADWVHATDVSVKQKTTKHISFAPSHEWT